MNNSREDRHYRYCSEDTPDNNDPFVRFGAMSRRDCRVIASTHIGIALYWPFDYARQLLVNRDFTSLVTDVDLIRYTSL